MGIRQSYILIFSLILLLSNNISSADVPDDIVEKIKTQVIVYSTAKQIEKYSEKYHLEYQDMPDLIETCSIVDKYSRYDNIFNKEDVLAIILKESRFKKDAKNLTDGGAGLGQITGLKTWWKDDLFWLKDPYDKDQNIKGIFYVLNSFYKIYGSKYKAIKHYNGSTARSDNYAKDIFRIRKDIFKI